MHKNNLLIQVAAILDKALAPRNKPLAPSFSAQRHNDLVKQGVTILKTIADSCQYHRRCDTPMIQQDSFNLTAVKELEEFMIFTISGVDSLKEESTRRL